MATRRARPPVSTTNTEYFLPARPPSWLQPSICTQPDFQSLNSSLDLLFMVNQHIRRHPLNTDPMPNQTYFQDHRAYNLLNRMRGDLILMDSLIDNLYHARRLLQFVPTGPGQASQGNTASTPQQHSHPGTWPSYTTHRQASLCHAHSPAAHPLQHHVHHQKMQNASTITGPVLHHVPLRTTPSAMTIETENGPDPVMPMLTNYRIQCHGNFAARNLQRPTCSLLHLRPLHRPQLLIRISVSPTLFGEHRRQKPSQRTLLTDHVLCLRLSLHSHS